MQIYKYPDKAEWPGIIARPVSSAESNKKMLKKILKKVRKKGDKALFEFTERFDGVKLEQLLVTANEIAQAEAQLPEELKSAILLAKRNIEKFHAAQQETEKAIETIPGINCWRRSSPIESVGFYVPGGSAPLFSTVLMLAVPAKIAACPSIVLCTPPQKDGSIHPAILYTASICGIELIAKIGGAQAIAAMAFGTETIPKVKKIFGPGNSFVTLAKQMVQKRAVAIDMPAGPSEVLVIADASADADFVAADLLSQAEHGPDSQVILITTDPELPVKVVAALENQGKTLPRFAVAEKSLENSRIIVLEELEQAFQLSDLYAPEHLILLMTDADKWAGRVRSAGSVFLGHYSPESVGDYASGTNHCLPTNGYAAMYSGVSVDSFVKRISFQLLSREGLTNISSAVMQMAEAEGLAAHKNAVAVRLKKLNNNDGL